MKKSKTQAPTSRTWPIPKGHYAGNPGQYGSPGCGFEVEEDGIRLAPMRSSEIDAISVETAGVDRLVHQTNDFVVKQYSSLSQRADQFWAKVAQEIGIDVRGWRYKNGKLLPPEPKKEDKPE